MTGLSKEFKTLFAKMPIPRFIVEQISGGKYKIICANDLALAYFNRQEQQVLDRDISQFMDSETFVHFQQSFEVCSKRKRSVSIQALPSVPGGVRVYGFWITPILDDEGELLYFDVIAQPNTSDESSLQRERDDAMSLIASIFEVSEIAIVVTDHAGRIVRVNDSFIRTYGWSREELINADFVELITPDERERGRRNHDKFVETGIRSSGEMRLIRRDGSIANALFTSATLELSQKRRFLVTTVMDITLRKQMEQSLRMAKEQADAANRAKSTFLANMSHELRTPLNAIIGFSEMMISGTFGPMENPRYHEYMKDIHTSAEHLLEIINEVLDMSKIEAGRIELLEEHISVSELVSSVVRMMASRIFASDLNMIINIPKAIPVLCADARLVRQIFINLLTNAVKFSKTGEKIMIEADIVGDGRMRLSIRDRGMGIPEDKIKQALEPFGQVNDMAETRRMREQGTGLGLPLAKGMVELHDGSLELESKEGEGTVVTLYFPAYRVVYEGVPASQPEPEFLSDTQEVFQ